MPESDEGIQPIPGAPVRYGVRRLDAALPLRGLTRAMTPEWYDTSNRILPINY